MRYPATVAIFFFGVTVTRETCLGIALRHCISCRCSSACVCSVTCGAASSRALPRQMHAKEDTKISHGLRKVVRLVETLRNKYHAVTYITRVSFSDRRFAESESRFSIRSRECKSSCVSHGRIGETRLYPDPRICKSSLLKLFQAAGPSIVFRKFCDDEPCTFIAYGKTKPIENRVKTANGATTENNSWDITS